jgi:hypothetical protein
VDISSPETSNEGDDVFSVSSMCAESVSSVSRDEDSVDTGVERQVRMEVRGGRAVVVPSSPYEERAKRRPGRSEDEICRLRYMKLREEKEHTADKGSVIVKTSKRQRMGEGVKASERRMGKRRKSSEEVWFTTLAQVSVVPRGEGREWASDVKVEELVFDPEEGVEVLFDEFSREVDGSGS